MAEVWVVVVVSLALVGRTGATPEAEVLPDVVLASVVEIVVELEGSSQDEVPQTRSEGQQPPPRSTGQAVYDAVQDRVV